MACVGELGPEVLLCRMGHLDDRFQHTRSLSDLKKLWRACPPPNGSWWRGVLFNPQSCETLLGEWGQKDAVLARRCSTGAQCVKTPDECVV